MQQKINPLDYDLQGLQDWFVGLGEKPWRARQLMNRIYKYGVVDVHQMTELGKPLRSRLEDLLEFDLPHVETLKQSADGTCKWLLGIGEGNAVETVFIPEGKRGTLCISSQAGCPLDCGFCATARQGFARNLSTAEIIAQVWLANRQLGFFDHHQRVITNVVFMGMGEPLLNYANVLRAIRLLCSTHGFGLARRRVTVSTAGVVPGIDKLAVDCDISLAISLHAVEDSTRDQLVPLNRHYPISGLLDACRRYAERRPDACVTIEYVMLKDVNDSLEQARRLVRLLRDIPAKVNLIPFNVFPGCGYACSSPQAIDRFRGVLMDAGLITITRRPRGDDIAAACGQLAGRVRARGTPSRARLQTGCAA